MYGCMYVCMYLFYFIYAHVIGVPSTEQRDAILFVLHLILVQYVLHFTYQFLHLNWHNDLITGEN